MESKLPLPSSKPTIEEIIKFASNRYNKTMQVEMYMRIAHYAPDDEALEGVKLFLDDHENDFKKLADFLQYDSLNIIAKKKRNTVYYQVAAAILLISGIYFYFVLITNHYHQKINQYSFKDHSFSVNAASDDKNKYLSELVNYYRVGEFENGFKYLAKNSEHIQKDTLYYLSALLLMESAAYQNAIDQFNLINRESPLIHKSNYFKGLTLLHLKQKKEAQLVLNDLVKSCDDRFIVNRAREILSNPSIW